MSDSESSSANGVREICANEGISSETTVVADLLGVIRCDPIDYIEELGLAGLILNSTSHDFNLSNKSRLGVWNKDGSWKLPTNRARTLILLGPSEEIGGKRLMACFYKQIHTIIVAGFPNYADSKSTPLLTFSLIYALRRAAALVHRLKENVLKYFRPQFPHLNSLLNKIEGKVISRSSYKLLNDISLLKVTPINGRVILINNGLAPGGAERQFVNTALFLKKQRDLDVRVIVLKSGDSYFDFYKDQLQNHVPVYNLYTLAADTLELSSEEKNTILFASNSLSLYKNKIYGLNFMDVSSFISALVKLKPSVVHIWQDSTNISAGIAAVKLGIPKIILGGRNMAPYRFAYFQPYMKSCYQALLEHPNVVLTNNSLAGAQDYEAWLGLAKQTIPVIQNGIEIPDLRSEENLNKFRNDNCIEQESIVVGSIFRFWPEKDPELWISVAAWIAQMVPRVQFLLVGEGPMKDAILDLAKRNKIDRLLVMPGYLKNPFTALLCMDVFLLTSKYEGTPNVLIEAQMAGVPAVTTDAGGCRDIIEEDKTGYVLFDRSPEKLATKTISLIQNREKRIEMSICAKNRARQKFGIQQMLNKTLELYFDKKIQISDYESI